MDDAQLLVEVEDGVDELLEDDRGLVLLEEAVPLGVLVEVALRQYFGDDVDVGLGLELSQKLDDVGVVALLQNPRLSF